MGKWDRRYLNLPRRKKIRHEEYEDPSPSEGIGTTGVPSWELDYCKSAKIPFGKILASKKYIYCYPSVLDWDASACEDALRNAKERYLAVITGHPSDHHPLPDPNMYIDEIDWNPYMDFELLAELELLRFDPDKAAREGEKSEESQSRELSTVDDNPWEGKKRKDCSNGEGGLKRYVWGTWNESLDWQPRNGSIDFVESSTWSKRDEENTTRFQKGNGNESWNQNKNKSSYNHRNESWNNKVVRNHYSEKSISQRPFHRVS